MLGLPLVEDDGIDKRLRLPRAWRKKPWQEQRLRQPRQVSTFVAQLDETSQRRRLQRQQQQKQQQQQQQQQQGSSDWYPAKRQSLSAPRTLLQTSATTRSRACSVVVPNPFAHSQWPLGTTDRAAAAAMSAREQNFSVLWRHGEWHNSSVSCSPAASRCSSC